MRVKEVRFNVKLKSPLLLAQYMDFRDLSVRKLADKVGCSPATIGHLRSGKRTTVRPEWAKAIQKALEAPPGLLFMPDPSTVERDVPQSRRAA